MTVVFLLALAITGFLMKLVALLTPSQTSKTRWRFVFSPLVSPNSFTRSRPLEEAPQVLLQAVGLLAAVAVYYWCYWQLVRLHQVDGLLLSYLGVPVVFLLGEVSVSFMALLGSWSGRLLPRLHNRPWLASGVADFWGRRWNLWFNDWFRLAIFDRLRHRPTVALLVVFGVSGLMHEWVVNVPLYWVTGQCLFGSMTFYFLLQAAGILFERQLPKAHTGVRKLLPWLIVFVPAPLVVNEGLLRALHLWPCWH